MSISSIRRLEDLPEFKSPRSITRERLVTSIFPPDTTHTTLLPLSGSLTEQFGSGFSYGQTWDQELSNYAQMEHTTAFFLKYDAPKWFSLTSAIKQASNQDIGTQYNTLRIVPEWHITDRLTLKDSFTAYMGRPMNKNEVTFVYTPALKKYAESLKFELGLAQYYYQSGKQRNAVQFSTGFKL